MLSYPSTPENVDPQVLQPSPQFKREAIKVLGAILFFILSYLLLAAAGVGLAALCVAAGIGLVIAKPAFITLMLGLGLAGLGVMVVAFLFKFLFKRHKVDRSGLIEIKEHDHPQLFSFIRALANETETSFPKRIYISPEVNASVFYDSSFWSMFLPVKKNLQIGLGLVNTVNISEFKAIIAHEFGHFSQRSMKLGSYVYNLNQVIFNLLYDNENYDRAIEKWANASGYFALFAGITIRIVKGIQWILQQVYTLVNKVYMSLSRQMEFHADTVSACVSGGNHLITSLRRLEVADITYNNVFGFYQDNFKKSFKPDNIYPQHREIMRVFSEFHGIPMEHGLPQVDSTTFAKFNKQRIQVKDQWASHPSTDDREKHLRRLQMETPAQHNSAWLLFNDAENLQRQVTDNIFVDVKYENPVQIIDSNSFCSNYQESFQRYQLPKIYKGFFDTRPISKIDLEKLEYETSLEVEGLESLLSEEVLALPYKKDGLASDLETLDSIKNGHINVKSFEFNGVKHKANYASGLLLHLENELHDTNKLLEEADRKIISWFLRTAEQSGNIEKLRACYKKLYLVTEETDKDLNIYTTMQQHLMPLYQVMQFADIERAISKLKLEEAKFRDRLQNVLHDPTNSQFITEDQNKTATEFLSKDWRYFFAESYIQQDLDRLNECLYLLYYVASEKAFDAKAELLNFQLDVVGAKEVLVRN